jgi:hypothetical protein
VWDHARLGQIVAGTPCRLHGFLEAMRLKVPGTDAPTEAKPEKFMARDSVKPEEVPGTCHLTCIYQSHGAVSV